MSRPILITVPKVQSIAPSDISSLSGSSDDTLDEFLVRGKKRRLDHLSWEEKVQRKKLKNRVAAQTSRDRKKAKMEDMEMKINYLTEQNSSLNSRYLKMKEQKELADKRNAELERQIAELNKRLQEKETNLQTSQPNGNGIGYAPNTTGSAESGNIPLPQGMGTQSIPQSANVKKEKKIPAPVDGLWKIIALCLLYKTCSKNSTPDILKNLPKVCSQMSPQIWKKVMQEAEMLLPKVSAPQSECLNQWWGPQQNSWNPAKVEA